MTGGGPEGDALATFRERMYRSYTTTHAGVQDGRVEGYAVRKRIVPMLPRDLGAQIVDIGCGQGNTVRALHEAGYSNACGVDISPEQVARAHAMGVRNVICQDFTSYLAERAGRLDAVLATDVLEHCTKLEVLELFGAVREALRPGGVFIARIPNGASPFVGRIQFGDFTHETSFTSRSLGQISKVTGFAESTCVDTGPVPHGLLSGVRFLLWKLVALGLKAALVVETGEPRGHLVGQTVILRAVR